MTTSTSSARREHAWDLRAWAGLGLLVFLMLAALPFLVSSTYEASDETNDASIYVATARALLAGDGYSYLGEPFIVRPPGFAVLLAGVMRVFGDAPVAWNLFVSLWGVLACALLYVFCVRRIGVVLALLCAAALFVHPDFRRMSNQVMSDVPGLALVLLCLLLERWAAAKRSWQRDLVLALAIGASSYVRTLALLLVPATLFARWCARAEEDRPLLAFARQRAAVLVLGVVLCVAPWSARCALHHPTPPVDQTFLYSYGTGMWHERPYDPASPRLSPTTVLARIPQRAEPIVTSLVTVTSPERVGATERGSDEPSETSTPAVLGGALLLACCAWMLAEKRRASEAFVALTVLLLCVYFAFRPRLVLPVQALAFPAVIEALVGASHARFGAFRAWIARLLAAAVLVACVQRLVDRELYADDYRERDRAYSAAAYSLSTTLTDERVASAIGWHWSVHLKRPVWSLALAGKRGGARAIQDVLERHGIDAVVLSDALPEDRALVPLMTKLWGEPARGGDVSLFRRRR
ncbi:MAG: glycosyltransferase family 39 protein [Planctomycetes bacterium]|nr:glycosyltransferase family 39 protein [Planctomycetota bacterium]